MKEPAFVITYRVPLERLGRADGMEKLFLWMELTQRLALKRPGIAGPGMTTYYWALHYAQDFSVATYM